MMTDEMCCMVELMREQERLRRATARALKKVNVCKNVLAGCILGLALIVRIQGEEIEKLKRKEEKRRAEGIFDDVR